MSLTQINYEAAVDSATAALVPLCLIGDTSTSMATGPGPIAPIDALNTGIASLFSTLKVHPEAADTAYVQLISLASSASVVLPYSHLDTDVVPPTLTAAGGTSYGAAFSLARREMEHMIATEKSRSPRPTVYRPTIYLITDGAPTDSGWEAELDTLATMPFAPNICVFGVHGADETTLRKIARRDRGMVWLAEARMDPAQAFAALFPSLVRTVMATANAAAVVNGGGNAPVPAPVPLAVPGMRLLDPL